MMAVLLNHTTQHTDDDSLLFVGALASDRGRQQGTHSTIEQASLPPTHNPQLQRTEMSNHI